MRPKTRVSAIWTGIAQLTPPLPVPSGEVFLCERPIDPRWVNKVIQHLVQIEQRHERLSDTRVYEALERDAETWRKSNDPELQRLAKLIPSPRSISRIRAQN